MWLVPRFVGFALALGSSSVALSVAVPAAAQLPRVSPGRPLTIGGILAAPHGEDLLGLSRIKFQGVIASELASVGYQVIDRVAVAPRRTPSQPPLNLVGAVKEEICDEQTPRQCRVAIQWELQDQRGVVTYRTLTRAVAQASTVDKERRDLIQDALRSLLQRRRFALQLTEVDETAKRTDRGPFGFKQCGRAAAMLPDAARAVAAALVFVESGSRLSAGAIVSPDGLILTSASAIDETAPLRVRLAAEQTLPAEVVALERKADVALLHVAGHFDTTCVPLREAAVTSGMPAFGISSPANEDRAVSLAGSGVQKTWQQDGVSLLQVDSRIAHVDGAPLLDEEGRLAGIVSAHFGGKPSGSTAAVEVHAALQAVQIKAAAITDPRLIDAHTGPAPAVGYVRDADDPPFALGRRYTFGTSSTAHVLRTAGVWTTAVGAVGVIGTWAEFRRNSGLTPHEYNRLVVLNDVSWVLLGLGVAGLGVSFALPEGHDVVAVGVQNAQNATGRPRFFVGLGAGGFSLQGRL